MAAGVAPLILIGLPVNVASALALAALRNQANMEDVATEHPVATGLMSAGMGAMAGAGLERAGRRLFAKEPWHAALNPYPLK